MHVALSYVTIRHQAYKRMKKLCTAPKNNNKIHNCDKDEFVQNWLSKLYLHGDLLVLPPREKRMMASGHVTGLVFDAVGLPHQKGWYDMILFLGYII